MIALTLDEVAGLCPGRLDAAAARSEVTGVKVDSRLVEPGDLFVAVNDAGADFVADALERGAAAALVPDDAFAALAALGGAVRDRSNARVVGITGSAGKTSTKDILAAICRRDARTVAAEASLNNEIGVPLTLCRLEPDTEVCILELSMRGPGQIAELCAFARPEVGVITDDRRRARRAARVDRGDRRARSRSSSTRSRPAARRSSRTDLPVRRDDLIVVRARRSPTRASRTAAR